MCYTLLKEVIYMPKCIICDKAKINCAVLCDFAMEKVSKFTVLDFAVFKTCVFSLGVLFGAGFSTKLKKCVPVIATIAISSYIYMIYKIFLKKD